MKISVIIPTYCPRDYIFDCLSSLCNQTFDKSLFEVIIVLNGCNQPYYDKLNDYVLDNMSNIFVRLIQTDLGGVSNARNIGLDNAQGEYIAFIDDDDVISDNYLKKLYDTIKDRDDVVVVSNVKTFENDYKNEVLGDDYLSREYLKNRFSDEHSIFKLRSFLSTSWCKLIPYSVIRNRYFDVNFKLGEDSLFMAMISDKIKAIILAESDVVYYRRLRSDSASRKSLGLSIRVKNCIKEWKQYFLIYFKSPLKYNLLFFLSRIVAVFFRNIVRY